MLSVAWLAVLAGTILSFALGAIWYGPLFGKAWMAEHGFTEADLRKDFKPAVTYGLTFVLAFVSAYVFGHFIGAKPGFARATLWGFLVGAAWIATAIATNCLFERSSLRLWLINGGYHTLRFGLIGIAFGVLG
jgi:hypothetical protein